MLTQLADYDRVQNVVLLNERLAQSHYTDSCWPSNIGVWLETGKCRVLVVFKVI